MRRTWRASTRKLGWPVLLLSAALLWFSLRSVNWSEVWAQLRALQPADLVLLALVNVVVLASFSARWWILLRAQGYAVPYHKLMGYRLAAFSVSYFTPGPHIGGEPLQGYSVTARHGVPAPVSAAAVLLDKAFELMAAFIFLIGGLFLVVRPGLLPGNVRGPLLATGVGFLLLPAASLVVLAVGKRPVSGVWDFWVKWWNGVRGRSPSTAHQQRSAYQSVRSAELQSTALCHSHPLWWGAAILATALSWVAIMAEFWLMTRILGLGLDFGQAMTALLAARWAALLPLPAGLGALEASQVIAMQALGFGRRRRHEYGAADPHARCAPGHCGPLACRGGLLRRKPAPLPIPARLCPNHSEQQHVRGKDGNNGKYMKLLFMPFPLSPSFPRTGSCSTTVASR